jgi:hypothetical protein
MSIEAIAKASKIRDLDSTTKFVLIALLNYATDEESKMKSFLGMPA